MNLKEPLYLTSVPNGCSSILQKISILVQDPEWVNNFQEIYAYLKKLSSSCTNADFHSPENGKQTNVTGGFQNRCAICVVITRVIDNYVAYHRKNITDFIER